MALPLAFLGSALVHIGGVVGGYLLLSDDEKEKQKKSEYTTIKLSKQEIEDITKSNEDAKDSDTKVISGEFENETKQMFSPEQVVGGSATVSIKKKILSENLIKIKENQDSGGDTMSDTTETPDSSGISSSQQIQADSSKRQAKALEQIAEYYKALVDSMAESPEPEDPFNDDPPELKEAQGVSTLVSNYQHKVSFGANGLEYRHNTGAMAQADLESSVRSTAKSMGYSQSSAGRAFSILSSGQYSAGGGSSAVTPEAVEASNNNGQAQAEATEQLKQVLSELKDIIASGEGYKKGMGSGTKSLGDVISEKTTAQTEELAKQTQHLKDSGDYAKQRATKEYDGKTVDDLLAEHSKSQKDVNGKLTKERTYTTPDGVEHTTTAVDAKADKEFQEKVALEGENSVTLEDIEDMNEADEGVVDASGNLLPDIMSLFEFEKITDNITDIKNGGTK